MAPELDSDLYPVPFPKDVAKIKLERIDLTKVLGKNEETARRLFHVCTHEGFFYLDLTTHPMGVRLIEQSHRLHNIGQSVFNNVSMADKRAFQPTDGTGYLDSGYATLASSPLCWVAESCVDTSARESTRMEPPTVLSL